MGLTIHYQLATTGDEAYARKLGRGGPGAGQFRRGESAYRGLSEL